MHRENNTHIKKSPGLKKKKKTLLGLFTTPWSGIATNEEWSSLEKLSREAADAP